MQNYSEIGGMSLMRWRAPEDHHPERFPTSTKSLSLFGVVPHLIKVIKQQRVS